MKLFRKTVSLVMALAMSAICLSTVSLPAVVVYAEPENIAPQGQAFDSYTDGLDVSGSMSDGNVYYSENGVLAEASHLNDGGVNGIAECWQYALKTSDGTYDISNVYCGIRFDVAAYVTEFSILGVAGVTETNSGDGFVPGGYNLSYYDGSSWHNVSASVSDDSLSIYHKFDSEVKLYAVKVEFTKRYKFHPKVAEIYVYGEFGGVDLAKASLSDALSKANALNSDAYTDESWAVLQNAVNNANSLNLNNASEDEIIAAANAIYDAISALKPMLEEAINLAAQYNETYYLYSPDSYNNLRTALNNAANLINSGVTDKATLKAAADNISSAIDAMLLTSGNIAPLGTAYADSEYSGDHTATKVNNGDMSDRWQTATSVDTAPAWIMIDFGEKTSMNMFEITWEVSRANGDGISVQYSDDNVSWNTATGVSVSDFTTSPIPDSTDSYYHQSITFDKISARYVRLYITAPADNNKKNPSIFEWEIYYNALAEFVTEGAQLRSNSSGNGNYDLRFRSVIPETYYTSYVLGVESVGTLVARAEQLKSDELSFETMTNASYKIVDLRTAYFNNKDTAQTGNYVFTATILNIADFDRNYVARTYIRFTDGSIIYGAPVMRCVRDGM